MRGDKEKDFSSLRKKIKKMNQIVKEMERKAEIRDEDGNVKSRHKRPRLAWNRR